MRGSGVRIIGGRWRGRRLAVPAATAVRPTPDRVRETLFNWLGPILPGAHCLDLFAGSGVLGLEALSRGAAAAWFVETDAVLVRALQEQVRDLEGRARDARKRVRDLKGRVQDVEARTRIIRRDALELLATSPAQPFEVVFADPPYAMNLADVLIPLRNWLAPEHRVYVERPVEWSGQTIEDLVAALPGARLLKQGRAARVAYGLIRLAAKE